MFLKIQTKKHSLMLHLSTIVKRNSGRTVAWKLIDCDLISATLPTLQSTPKVIELVNVMPITFIEHF